MVKSIGTRCAQVVAPVVMKGAGLREMMRIHIAMPKAASMIAGKRKSRQYRAEIGKEAMFYGAKDGAIRLTQLVDPIAQELERYVQREERAI